MKHLRGGNFVYEGDECMDSRMLMYSRAMYFCTLLALLFALLLCAGTASGETASGSVQQTLFASPDEATTALVNAVKAKDQTALAGIFGPQYDQLLSGDAVQDNHEMESFAAAADHSAKLVKAGDAKFTLTIGENNWPFPIPIVREGDKWRFDTTAGMEEILDRRIGENELSAIATCRAYVLAQWEYFTDGDLDNDGVSEYAQKFISTPGKRDGLYWETAQDGKQSPLGVLVAAARTEGYSAGRRATAAANNDPATQTHPRSPYHGYYFKILKAQGPHAPGGKYGYIINGNMIGGYALIAYPDKWGSSGVMTFIVNQQGRVYEKNLGPKTAAIAGAITTFDPDPSWRPVKE